MAEDDAFNDAHPRHSVFIKMEIDEDGMEGIDSLNGKETKSRKRKKKTKTTTISDVETNKEIIFNCEHCDFKSKYNWDLKTHNKSYHGKSGFSCQFCPYTTTYADFLKEHMKCHKIFECSQCPYKTTVKNSFNHHQRKHVLNLRNAVRRSKMKTIEADKPIFRCQKCPYYTTLKGHYLKHLAKVHYEKSSNGFRCEFCGCEFKKCYLYEHHIDRSYKDSVINCKECDFESWYFCEYRRHRKCHPQKVKKKHIRCISPETSQEAIIVDGQEFPRKPNSHLKYDKTKQFLINTKCILNWKNIPVNEFQEEGKKKVFQCTQCTFTANAKKNVKYHVERDHTDSSVKPYLCLNCDFAAKTDDQMKNHNKIAKSDVQLDCKSCLFSSRFKCQLRMHESKHRPYCCMLCDHRFCDSTKLRFHYMEIHSHSDYKCEHCDFNTTRMELMIEHGNKHSGLKGLKCNECDFSCESKTSLREHILKNHQDKTMVIITEKRIEYVSM